MLSMIENNLNASQTTDEQLASDLNGSDSLPLMACSESNKTILNTQSESKLSSSDYSNMSVTTDDLNFRIFPSTTYGDILQENKWSVQSPTSVELPSKITPAPSPKSSNPNTPASAQTQYNMFSFSPLIPSPNDSFDSSNNVEKMESARLRTLLTTSKRTDVSSDENLTNKHNILKGLLDPDEIASQSVDELQIHDTLSPTNIKQASYNSNLNYSSINNNILLKVKTN